MSVAVAAASASTLHCTRRLHVAGSAVASVVPVATPSALKYDLANQPDVANGSQMLSYIQMQWLSGRSTSDVLRDALHGLRYREGVGKCR